MAGLLGSWDQFSTGLRNNPAAQQGLLAFGSGLLSSMQPGVSMGQALGAAGLQSMQGYHQGLLHQKIRDEAQEKKEQKAAQRAILDRAKSSGKVDPQTIGLLEAFPSAAPRILAGLLGPEKQDDPAKRYRVVGTDLVDLKAEGGPSIAMRGSRDSGPLVPVFDPDTGQTIYTPRDQAAGRMAPPRTGMEISYDEANRPIVRTGVITGGNGGSLQRSTAGKLEEELLGDTAAAQRLQAIEQSWRPEYSEVMPRAGMEWASLKDKFGQLGEGEKQSLRDFSRWRQDAISNLNRTIKEITGAAMSIQEAERITKELPAPGVGIFDGDSPTVFKSKLDNAMRKIKLGYARKAYIRQRGFPVSADFAGISLEQMPQIIDQRGAELESQYAAQGMPPDQIMQTVAQQLKAEFGL